MPIHLKKGLGRRPPPIPENEPLARHIRLAEEETERRLHGLAQQVSSKLDEVTFESLGDGKEVRIANNLGMVPNRAMCVAMRGHKGDLYACWPSRDKLADEDFIYLKTNAPKGVMFTVRLDLVG